jgi:glycerol uptake facilitator-like aquaporin
LTETTAVSYFIATSVGIAIAVSYMLFSSISGGHFNPAITVGMWTARKISTLRSVGYVVAQLLGGLAAWQLYQYFTDHHLAVKSAHFSAPLWLAELVGTMVFAMGVSSVVYKTFTAFESAFTVGASLFVGVLIAATASAGILNPAVALALRSFNGVYIIGPLLGGILGVNLYNFLFVGDTPKVVRRIKK